MAIEPAEKKLSSPANAGDPADIWRNLEGLCSASPGWSAAAGHDTEEIVQIARSWIGTPYVHQAATRGAGCDCLGLLRGVVRELIGAEPETPPPYSPDWAEATGAETLYSAMLRHLSEIDPAALAPGNIALFRMSTRGPAKHCGIIGLKNEGLTLIHARQGKRVSEEALTPLWRRKLAFGFRL